MRFLIPVCLALLLLCSVCLIACGGGSSSSQTSPPPPPPPPPGATQLTWEGEVPAQKWMNFYTKVLTRFAANKALKLTVRVELATGVPIPAQKVEDMKVSLRELSLKDDVEVK